MTPSAEPGAEGGVGSSDDTEGGSRTARSPRRLRDEEPFRTIQAYPRRFGWGIPLVFLVSIGGGVLFVGRSLSLGIAIQLGLQTVGLLWLYVPALRRRLREEGEGGEARGDGPRTPPGPRQG